MTRGGGSQHERGSWGAFLEHAREYGVEIRSDDSIPGPGGEKQEVRYLFRQQPGGPPLWHVMPNPCPTSRRMGFPVMVMVCSLLGIPEVKDWPIEF